MSIYNWISLAVIIVGWAAAVYCCTDGTKCVATDSSGWKSAALS